MEAAREVAVGFAIASVLGRVANRVAEAVQPPTKDLIDGFPRCRWTLGVFQQAVIFPGFFFWALWLSSPSGTAELIEWLSLSSREIPFPARWYVYALFGSMMRDMPMPKDSSTTLKLHHWVVLIACVLVFMVPKAFGIYVAGTFVLEFGSLFFNLRKMHPGSTVIVPVYQVTMLASNVAAVLLGVLLLQIKEVPLAMRLLFFATDVGVVIGRQHHALKDAGLLGSSHHHTNGKHHTDAAADAMAASANGAASASSSSASASAAKGRERRPATNGVKKD